MPRKPLPEKTCLQCGRPFAWRRKWRRDWNDVLYCSKRCRGVAGTARRAGRNCRPAAATAPRTGP
ncbi:DUF2256 domain-containing protein [Tropicimonas marinistellae]|uniref:DUF2256 domain-containing protein n=1 Tax=Tropicimonas marinistellae TaxID=1739787 RepID=UPI00098F475D|nr:DUF2256 domain-containing protein [Tropicimonas marinistellae]